MRSGKAVNWTASAWLPAGFVLTLPAYLWHQNYFRSAGSYFLLIRALPVLCFFALAYTLWMRPLVKRYEFLLLLLFPFAMCCAVRPLAVASVSAIMAAALLLGDCLTPILQFKDEDAPAVWSCGVGLLILIGALLGKIGMLSAPIVLSVFALCFVRAPFIWRRLLAWLTVPFARWQQASDLPYPASGVCVFFLFFFTACSLLVALTPVTAFDVVAYHFPLARHYAQSHTIQPTLGIIESYYPQGAEVLMALGFLLGGEQASSLLMPCLGVLFLWLLMRVGKCCGLSRSATFAGTAIAATFPFLQWTFTVSKNDSALSLFQLAALYSFLQWQAGRGWRWLILLAFLLGQTAGIKHVALIGLIAMAPLYLFAWWREKCSLWIAFPAMVVFVSSGLFWHAQTWLIWGDPTFPAHMNQAIHTPAQEHGAPFVRAAIRYVTLPWYLLFQGQKAFESASPNPMGMLCFLFTPVAIVKLWSIRWTHARKACFCYVLIYLVYWCSILSTLRYAIVPLSLGALGLGATMASLLSVWKGFRRTALLGLLSYGFLFSLLVFMSIAVNSSQAAFLLKRIGTQEFLIEVAPAMRPLFRLANIAPGAAVFGVNTCARYYAPNPLLFSCALCEDHCLPQDILQPLRAGKFDYAILPSGPEFQQLKNTVITTTGASLVEDDGHFAILQLSKSHSPR